MRDSEGLVKEIVYSFKVRWRDSSFFKFVLMQSKNCLKPLSVISSDLLDDLFHENEGKILSDSLPIEKYF